MTDERRAFEGLVFQSLRKMEAGDVDLSSIREATDEEKRMLERIRESDFMKNLLAGEVSEDGDIDEECDAEEDLACAGAGGELFRTDGIDEETAEELDELDREVIDRKLQERRDKDNDKTS